MIRPQKLLWTAVAIIGIVPLVYFLSHVSDTQFLREAMGDWFATMLGAIIGIPIALALSRWQQREQEKHARLMREEEALERRTKVLRLIRQELLDNRERLTDPRMQGEDEQATFVRGLSNSSWRVMFDGGELKLIGDPELLAVISDAYHVIARILFLEDLLVEAHFLLEPAQNRVSRKEGLITLLIAVDEDALQRVKEAVTRVEESISRTGSKPSPGE